MANNVGVTAAAVVGNTLTVTLGVTGTTAIGNADLSLTYNSAGITSTSATGLNDFQWFGSFQNLSGIRTIVPAELAGQGTNIISLEFEFSALPASFTIHLDGEYGLSLDDLTPVDVVFYSDGSYNNLPNGGVQITGNPVEGNQLTASNTIEDCDGLTTITYHWQADNVDIGATGSTYVLTANEAGKVITAEARYTDGEGNSEIVESAATSAVTGLQAAPVGVADVVSATEDQQAVFLASTLLANDTDPNDDPLVISSVSSISGGTVTLQGGDVLFTPTQNFNGAASFSYVASDGNGGFTQSTTVTVNVAQVNDPVTGTVVIEGDFAVGETLQAISDLTDPDGIDSPLSYRWFRDGIPLQGASDQNYILVEDDIGQVMRVRVIYTDGDGNEEIVYSKNTLIQHDNNAPTGSPVIKGDLIEGAVLSADTSTIADADGLGTFSFQWLRDGAVIGGATQATYQLASDDVGSLISLRVNYIDGGGANEQLLSADTAEIAGLSIPNNSPTGLAAVFGNGEPGQTLEVNADSIADQDGLGSFAYHWFVDGEQVTGAATDSFLLTQSEIGKQVKATVEYTDGRGFAEMLESEVRLVTDPLSDSFAELIKVYVIILGRAPAKNGLEFWSDQINSGKSFEAVATAMWNSAGAREVYPPGLTAEQQVTSFYENILNRSPAESGLQFWSDSWDTLGPVETMLRMMTALSSDNSSDPQAIVDKVLFQAKVDIGGYLAVTLHSNDVDLAADAYTFLEAGNSVEETVNYIDEQIGSIVNHAPTGLAVVVGDGEPGETLEINADAIADADGLGAFAYQWFVDDELVSGATSTSFLLTETEIGKQVHATVQYIDGRGFFESLESGVRLVTEPLSDSFAELIKVFITVLGRSPLHSGLEFWSDQINEGRTFEQVADDMWNSAGAQEVYPPELTTQEKVTSFYENILDRSPAESGLQFWSDSWDTVGPVDTMLAMIEALSSNNSTNSQATLDKALFQAKVDIGGYLAVTLESEDVDLAANAYEFLDAGNSVEETVDYIDQQLGVIGMSPAEDLSML